MLSIAEPPSRARTGRGLDACGCSLDARVAVSSPRASLPPTDLPTYLPHCIARTHTRMHAHAHTHTYTCTRAAQMQHIICIAGPPSKTAGAKRRYSRACAPTRAPHASAAYVHWPSVILCNRTLLEYACKVHTGCKHAMCIACARGRLRVTCCCAGSSSAASALRPGGRQKSLRALLLETLLCYLQYLVLLPAY